MSTHIISLHVNLVLNICILTFCHSSINFDCFVSSLSTEVVKTGKLYLVDLAGSENISRSGAQEGRAQEAGNINKSLLTLGRVITALVERKPHIPYRDSKLTRLLQDSLGGRNKTTIIATVSPALNSIDETVSTLEYAFKAKNILNKPEINQRVSKDVHVKEVYAELEKAKRDLDAAWAKTGVTLSKETYDGMQEMLDARKEKIQALELDIEEVQKLFSNSKEECDGLKKDLFIVQDQFRILAKRLKDCRAEIFERDSKLLAMDMVDSELRSAESHNVDTLIHNADVAEESVSHLDTMHDRFGKRKDIEKQNEIGFANVASDVSEKVQECRSHVSSLQMTHAKRSNDVRHYLEQNSSNLIEKSQELKQFGQSASEQLDFFAQWATDISNKYRFGDEIDAVVRQNLENVCELFSGLSSTLAQFQTRMDEVRRSGREEMERKREETVALFTNHKHKFHAFHSEVFGAIDDFATESEPHLDRLRTETNDMHEKMMAYMNEHREKVFKMVEEMEKTRGKIVGMSSQWRQNGDELVDQCSEENSKQVSQFVDGFYLHSSETGHEVEQIVKEQVPGLEKAARLKMEQSQSQVLDKAGNLDRDLNGDLTDARKRNESAIGQCKQAVEKAEEMGDKITSISNHLDDEVKQLCCETGDALESIDRQVEEIGKVPSNFIDKDLKVYEPTGKTPKPQSWLVKRDAKVVAPTSELVGKFVPPSNLQQVFEQIEDGKP